MKTKRIRLLLIEADAKAHELIKSCLLKSSSGIELVWCNSLAAGLTESLKSRFDVILSDLILPDSIGLETVDRIRRNDVQTPLVVLTTLDDKDVELISLANGAQEYLLKSRMTPFSLDKAIQHAIQRQKSIVEIQRLLTEVRAQQMLLVEQRELLNKKNKRLRKLYRTAHRFVDNVSHEFRTPLTVIKDYVSLVREGLVGEVNTEQCRMLDIANIRADELNNMVDDMLDVSKLESGLLGCWRRPCRLEEIVDSVSPPLMKRAEMKGMKFHIEIGRDLPTLYCDADKAGRVIINLVTNAIKFSPEQSTIRLWAHDGVGSGEVCVGVSDDGPGIDPSEIAEIFKRFKQLRTNMKHGTKGFGLGLNIAKELVDLNLGAISIESRIGEGTTFSFSIPVNDPHSVIERYLARMRKLKATESAITLARAAVPEAASDSDADDIDSFLSSLLRRNDLLFRVGKRDWKFILALSGSEWSHFQTRAESEWKKINRNRHMGPLQAFEFHVEDSCDALADNVLQEIASFMNLQCAAI